MNELFDPFNLPGDQPYRGSVYEQMDMIIAGAYAYYGYDLADLARRKQDNPLTDQMILDYLDVEGSALVIDPATGASLSVYDWLQSGAIGATGGVFPQVIETIEVLDPSHPMNYERNYLAALLEQYPLHVSLARINLRNDLVATFGDDAAAIYEYLEDLDQFGTE